MYFIETRGSEMWKRIFYITCLDELQVILPLGLLMYSFSEQTATERLR